jgi:hypothetical protein
MSPFFVPEAEEVSDKVRALDVFIKQLEKVIGEDGLSIPNISGRLKLALQINNMTLGSEEVDILDQISHLGKDLIELMKTAKEALENDESLVDEGGAFSYGIDGKTLFVHEQKASCVFENPTPNNSQARVASVHIRVSDEESHRPCAIWMGLEVPSTEGLFDEMEVMLY